MRVAMVILSLATLTCATPAASQTFADAPIACGSMVAFKSCKASFDGWTLSIMYVLDPAKPSIATYRQCELVDRHITCAAGEWTSGALKGPLGGRTIALRSGLPFAD
ncbi:MAG: hypothetical protein ACRCTI_03445 [Beijerinckiaceae bacterium]